MRFASLLWFALLAGSLLSSRAHAQSSEYDGYITQALQAYENGRFAEARGLFRRAHELDPTARTFRTIGMCSFNLGDYVDAVQNLEAATADPRKPLTADQQKDVAQLIERANQKVGRFRLKLEPETASVTVDGAAPVLIGKRELVLEPGRHRIAASASGYQNAERELAVEPGDRATLDLRLAPGGSEAGAPAVPPAAAESTAASAALTAPEPEELPAARGGTQRVLGIVALGLGGAGLVTFGVTGGLALGKKSDLDGNCPGRKCGPAYHSEVDSYDRLKLISTIGLISGVAFGAAGALLLLTAGHDAAGEHAGLVPVLAPGFAGVRGRL